MYDTQCGSGDVQCYDICHTDVTHVVNAIAYCMKWKCC
jgi:hypothetical protein